MVAIVINPICHWYRETKRFFDEYGLWFYWWL